MANDNTTKQSPVLLILLLLIVLVIGFICFANSSFSDNALSNLHLPKMGLDSKSLTRSTANGQKDPFEKGVKALADEDYTTAITFFESVPDTSQTYTQARLYLAYAQFQEESYDAVTVSYTHLTLPTNREV